MKLIQGANGNHAFYLILKRKQQPPERSEASSIVAGISNRVFKFDVTLDILEEDSKGFCSVARDKNCFKLRQNLFKKVSITVQQLTNQHLIVERFVIIAFRMQSCLLSKSCHRKHDITCY